MMQYTRRIGKRFQGKETGVLNSMDMKSKKNKMIYWGIFVVLFFVALVCLLPPLWILVSSFKSTKELMQVPPKLLPESWNLDKFKELWNNLEFGRYYLNTLIIAIGSIIFSIVCNGLAGYVLSCLKPVAASLYATLILWTMLLPNTLSIVALFRNIVDFPIFGWNLTNTYWPMWFISGANAFQILLYKNYFDDISSALVEAARLDGCNRVGIFTKIILPLSKSIAAVDAIFTLNGVWGDFLLPYITLGDKKKKTVMLAIYGMSGGTTYSIDQQLVGIVFAIVPPIIIFFFLQKYIMGGVNLGGVKE